MVVTMKELIQQIAKALVDFPEEVAMRAPGDEDWSPSDIPF
jgi:predicted RNA-binding protein YlqC (UPF0109 family)